MRNTRETDYAIRCVFHLASDPDRLHMMGEIAANQEVPKSFLAKILQKLAKAKIVSSVRGIKGGFSLARKPSEVTLLHVIEAIQGPLFINSCVLDSKSCSRKGRCSIHPIWIEIQEFLAVKLGGYNFKNITHKNMVASLKGRPDSYSSLKHGNCALCNSDETTPSRHRSQKKRLAGKDNKAVAGTKY